MDTALMRTLLRECECAGITKIAAINVVGNRVYVLPSSYWKKGPKHGNVLRFKIKKFKYVSGKYLKALN